MSKTSGIYMITNNTNGKKYIGSAVDLKQRETDHWKNLRANKHRNKHLQNAWNKYGEEIFSFAILEFVKDVKNLISCEQRYLDLFKPEYNKCPTAGNMLGFKHTPEARRKQREAKLKSWQDPGYRENMIKAHIGYCPSEQTRKKIGDISRGELNGYSKLTEGKVRSIKRLLERGIYHKDIAKIFNVSLSTINKISRGVRWAHVQLEEVETCLS